MSIPFVPLGPVPSGGGDNATLAEILAEVRKIPRSAEEIDAGDAPAVNTVLTEEQATKIAKLGTIRSLVRW